MSKEKEPAIVTIRRRHTALTESSREINETYSSLLSALIFPVVLQKTLFSENSPFYQIFIDYFSTYAPQVLKEMDLGIDALENLGKLKDQMSSQLENLPPPNPLFSSILKAGTSDEKLRSAFFSIAANVCRQQGCRTQADETKVIEQIKAEFMEEAQLNVLRALKGVKVNIPNLRKNMPRFTAELEFTNLMNAPKIIGVWLGKRFIMDPMLQRFLKNGVEPLPRFLELQSPPELRALLAKLDTTEKAQKIPARRAAKISMSILPLVVMLYFLQAISGFRIPQTFWLTCFSLLISGTTHFAYEVKKRYDERNYRFKLQNNTHACENLFNNVAENVSSQDFRSLKNSRIFITFKNYNDLIPNQVCRTIVPVLKDNGITPVDALGGSLWLRGATILSESKVSKLQNEITLALDSKKERRIQKIHHPLDKTQWSEDLEPKPKTRRVKPQLANNNNEPILQIEPQAAPVITWPAAKGKATSQIINAVGKNRFTLFNLSKNDFHTDDCYKKFKSLITADPKVVSLLANQGLVYSKKFGGTLKAKALGEFGNVRVYASKREIADTGETLYVFDRVIPKAH